MTALQQYKPAASKAVLLFLAGISWTGVGIMLITWAIGWLSPSNHALLFAAIGTVIGLVVQHFGFTKIVNKNLKRLLPLKKKLCLFAFIPWKSYLIIGVMITMGSLLRHSDFPKPYLAIIYLAMGLALALSSLRYLRYCAYELMGKPTTY